MSKLKIGDVVNWLGDIAVVLDVVDHGGDYGGLHYVLSDDGIMYHVWPDDIETLDEQPSVPEAPLLCTRILRAVEANHSSLNMTNWHGRSDCYDEPPEPGCDTTHCLAGWAVHLTDSYRLEAECGGPGVVGLLLFLKSGVSRITSFHVDEATALEWLREQSARELAEQSGGEKP